MLETMRINEIQAVLGGVLSSLTEEENYTPQNRLERHREEYLEAVDAMEKWDGKPESTMALADEFGDMVITSLTALHSLGVDAERVLENKMDIIFRKYNPHKHKELVRNGMTHKEAQKFQKSEWRNKQ